MALLTSPGTFPLRLSHFATTGLGFLSLTCVFSSKFTFMTYSHTFQNKRHISITPERQCTSASLGVTHFSFGDELSGGIVQCSLGWRLLDIPCCIPTIATPLEQDLHLLGGPSWDFIPHSSLHAHFLGVRPPDLQILRPKDFCFSPQQSFKHCLVTDHLQTG